MNIHPLDRPVWHALNTQLAKFSEGDANARRFLRDVNLFAAAREDSNECLQALSSLVPDDGPVILLQRGDVPEVPNAKVAMAMDAIQMVAERVVPSMPGDCVTALTSADASAMLELATLTQPGPYLLRTSELGQFWGVKENGVLLAMAGERMKFDGYCEVSGVCTHPDARGRGFAGLLSRIVATRIQQRGETPYLHALSSNHGAIRLYEKLGFAKRCDMQAVALVK